MLQCDIDYKFVSLDKDLWQLILDGWRITFLDAGGYTYTPLDNPKPMPIQTEWVDSVGSK